jgi:hypothetical protein
MEVASARVADGLRKQQLNFHTGRKLESLHTGSSISLPCQIDGDPKNSLVFLSTNVSKVSFVLNLRP